MKNKGKAEGNVTSFELPANHDGELLAKMKNAIKQETKKRKA